MASSARAVLAIDVGTSSTRASLYDPRGEEIPGTTSRVTYRPHTDDSGVAELDADALVDAVFQVMDGALSSAPGTEVLAVGVTTFWHSLLGLDAHNRPTTPLMPWLDSRAADSVSVLAAQIDVTAMQARTGCMPHWSYWPARLLWLRLNQPELFARTRRWVSFSDYLLLRVTGEMATSVSLASGTGLFGLRTLHWDSELLRVCGADHDQLPGVVSETDAPPTARAEIAARWPSLRGVPWLPAVGDGATSNVGAGCLVPNRAALMVGTSVALRTAWRGEAPDVPWGLFSYRVDAHRPVLGGAMNDGGQLMDWLRRAFDLPSLVDAEREVAGMKPDAHGLTLLPFLAGERSPGWAAHARGSLLGLSINTQPVDILRAAMEAVALRVSEIDRLIPRGDEVVATGGALLHSPAWLQIMADVLGRPVHVSAVEEGSSRGAALLALERLGLLDQPLEDLSPPITRTFEPNPDAAAVYAAAADRQRRIYGVLVNAARAV